MAYSIATLRRAEQILRYGIQDGNDARTYPVVDGIVYTDLFTGTPTVTGYSGTIVKRFNGVQGSDYFNEIHVDDCHLKELTVTAVWGDDDFLEEIDKLLSWLDGDTFTDAADDSSVQSKKIEDFSVSFKDAEGTKKSLYEALMANWSFYIRNPIILSVTKEQRHDERYF